MKLILVILSIAVSVSATAQEVQSNQIDTMINSTYNEEALDCDWPRTYLQNTRSWDCQIGVACYPQYEKESGAVVKILVNNGNTGGTGFMVATTDLSLRPFIITSAHNIDLDEDGIITSNEIGHFEAGEYHFHYKLQQCQMGTPSNMSCCYNGAILRVLSQEYDIALFEINDSINDPRDNPNLCWLGWSRNTSAPTNGVMLHHPNGLFMEISTEDDTFTTSQWGSSGPAIYWKVEFDEGARGFGSSGAPLLDQNKRVVGILRGGPVYNNYCDQILSKAVKFSEAWTGEGTISTRLSGWLDPIGTNTFIMNSATVVDRMKIAGSTVPAINSQYHIDHILPGYSVLWSYTAITGSPTFTTSGNTCTLSNASKEYVKGTLTAKIYFGGSVVKTITKTIDSAGNFHGTYSQEGGQVFSFVNGTTYYPPIPTTNFYDGAVIEFHKQHTATISSPLFSSCILARDNGSNFPGSWVQNGSTVTYNPSNHGPVVMPITGTGINSYDVFKFTVGLAPEPLIEGLNLGLQSGNGTLTLTLVNAVAESEEGRSDVSGKNDLSSDADLEAYASSIVWHVIISNIQTGDIVFNGNVTGQTPTISTAGWPAGIYAVHAEVEGIQLSGKIAIR